MKKLLIASASAVALLGLAACGDTDDTTTQSVDPAIEQPAPQDEMQAVPPAQPLEEAPAEEVAPAN